MMRRIFIVLLTVSMLFLSSCSPAAEDNSSKENSSNSASLREESSAAEPESQPLSSKPEESEPQNTVEFEAGDFTLLIPSDWKASESKSDSLTTYTFFVDDFFYQFQLHTLNFSLDLYDYSAKDISEEFIKGFASAFSTGGIDQNKTITVNNLDVVVFTASGTFTSAPNQKIYLTGAVAAHDRSVFVLLLNEYEGFDHTESFNTLLDTLQVKDSEPSVNDHTSESSASEPSAESSNATESVPSEYLSALSKARQYSNNLYMSKSGIYDQLVSTYGEGFSAEAAQYAVDNLDADYNKNALKKAQSYVSNLYMSKARLYDQLTSEYGEGFTEEEAQYAVDNVKADWKANALEKAKSYQKNMSMSPSEIWDQLVSQYGEGFTEEEADYAIENLPK